SRSENERRARKDAVYFRLPGRKRSALQTSSSATCRTGCTPLAETSFARTSRSRSVSSCPAFGYAIHATRSPRAGSLAGAAASMAGDAAASEAEVGAKKSTAPVDAAVVATSPRSTDFGFPMTRIFSPGLRFSFFARLMPASYHEPSGRRGGVRAVHVVGDLRR